MTTHTLMGLLRSPLILLAPVWLMIVIEASASDDPGESYALRAAKVFTATDDDPMINHGMVWVEDGRIKAVGRHDKVELPEDVPVHDLGNVWLLPGFVEGHNHTIGSIFDLNDTVHLTNPGLSAAHTVTPGAAWIKEATWGGVTTGLLIPGSGSNMGGWGIVCKFAGDTIEEMTLRNPGSLKIAQAGNPERYWFGPQRSFMNYNTRQTLQKGKEYADSWEAFEKGEGPEPLFDPRWDHFRGLFKREFPASMHTQIYQVVLATVMMINDEFGISTMIDHGTFDSYLLGEEVAKREMYVINGPRQFHWDRLNRQVVGNCWGWYENGVRERLGVNTDCISIGDNIQQEDLAYQMTMAMHLGLDDVLCGLRGITIVPARGLHIDDRVGSLEVGKDADMTVFPGNPLDPRHHCLQTYIDGKKVYDAERDGRKW